MKILVMSDLDGSVFLLKIWILSRLAHKSLFLWWISRF